MVRFPFSHHVQLSLEDRCSIRLSYGRIELRRKIHRLWLADQRLYPPFLKEAVDGGDSDSLGSFNPQNLQLRSKNLLCYGKQPQSGIPHIGWGGDDACGFVG